MRRLLLITVFLAAGIPLLLWFSGGTKGPGSDRSEPEVERKASTTTAGPDLIRPMNLPVNVDVIEGYSQSARPEALTFVDPRTGEAVVVPAFERWYFKAHSGKPVKARRSGRQAVLLEDVELLTYREPQNLGEARAIERGEKLVKWRVTAPRARVDDLALQSLDEQPGGPETVVQLSGGVRIFDMERDLEIQGEALEIQPYLDRSRGTGSFVVQHEAFELTGKGLEIERTENRSKVVIRENAIANLHGDFAAPDGRPLLDLGSADFEPGLVRAEGGAVLVHRVGAGGGREDLSLEMTRVVHAEQEGGRSLDADTIRLHAYLVPTPATPGEGRPKDRWRVRTFEAEGDAIIIYPGRTDDDKPYTITASAHRIVYEVTPGVPPTVLLERDVEITVGGDVPIEGLGSPEGPSEVTATAREQAVLRPAPTTEVRAGDDPTRYRLVELRGDARLAFRGAGMDPTRDTLEGEQMRLLLKERTDAEIAAIRERAARSPGASDVPGRAARIVAVNFAVLGDVRLGGSRMSGMTHRLVGRDLDLGSPVFEASGPGTSFAFHGLRRGERLLGGDDSAAPPSSPSGEPAEGEAEWVFQRLAARGRVVVETTLGGPSVGMPTRLEGAELTYDRISDLARIVGTEGATAHLTVGTKRREQRLSARSMQLDRGRGTVEARGRVRGTLVAGSRPESGTTGGLLLPERRLGTPATFGVATNGRIEIRSQVGSAPWDPRLDTEQVIVVDGEGGELVAEMTSDTLKTDRLRARYLEVALMRSKPDPLDAPTTATARIGGPRATPRGTREATPEERLVPWTVETEILQARFGLQGLLGLEASGGIRFSSAEGELGGRTFRYDASSRQASLRGKAHATFGPAEGRSEVRADDLVMTLGESGPERLEAIGRTLAVLIRRAEDDPTIMERFFVWCRGVTMTPAEFRTDDLDQVMQQKRQLPDGPWTSPFSLWSNRIVVTGRDLLSRKTAEVDRLVATGPRTTLQTGEGAEQTTVWGDRFELDVRTSRATLASGPSGDLKIQLGTTDDERMRLDQTRLVIDIETGEILDWKHSKVVMRGARK